MADLRGTQLQLFVAYGKIGPNVEYLILKKTWKSRFEHETFEFYELVINSSFVLFYLFFKVLCAHL